MQSLAWSAIKNSSAARPHRACGLLQSFWLPTPRLPALSSSPTSSLSVFTAIPEHFVRLAPDSRLQRNSKSFLCDWEAQMTSCIGNSEWYDDCANRGAEHKSMLTTFYETLYCNFTHEGSACARSCAIVARLLSVCILQVPKDVSRVKKKACYCWWRCMWQDLLVDCVLARHFPRGKWSGYGCVMERSWWKWKPYCVKWSEFQLQCILIRCNRKANTWHVTISLAVRSHCLWKLRSRRWCRRKARWTCSVGYRRLALSQTHHIALL